MTTTHARYMIMKAAVGIGVSIKGNCFTRESERGDEEEEKFMIPIH